MNDTLNTLTLSENERTGEAISLLMELISIPSFSREEEKTANSIGQFFRKKSIEYSQVGNNIFAVNRFFDPLKKSILLNSHHDTVKPNPKYSRDPFNPSLENGCLYGLGSNDAGGCLVSLISVFCHYYNRQDLKYNLVIAATAEEEISGSGGIELTLPYLPPVEFAIVGEPTKMEMAVAERGLMVLDCVAHGKAGHAARNEGDNAIYKAMKDIKWFQLYQFPRESELLGPSAMNVTSINTENKAHNVVPATCHFIVDVRVNEKYSFEEIISIIKENVECDVSPRSTRLKSTSIPLDHEIVKAGTSLKLNYYGSPTTSDKALMPFPSVKMGPGDSARSHTADEFIFTREIEEGINIYISLLDKII